MSTTADRLAMKELLRGLTDLEVRERAIDALRAFRKSHPNDVQVAMHGPFGAQLVAQLLNGRTNWAFSGTTPQGAILDATTEPGMDPIAEFINWFTRAGFAWPLGAPTNQYPITLHLTRAGIRLLDGTNDHPLLPGFVDRLVRRCPNLPVDIQSLLVDATSCLDHALVRPAIQLMGVAYEVAVERIVEALIVRAILQPAVVQQRAATRIAAVKAEIDGVLPNATPQEREDRFAVHAAFDFADQLRRRRNDAAHTTPRYDFSDREEGEEFLVSAGRHLPNLWRMH